MWHEAEGSSAIIAIHLNGVKGGTMSTASERIIQALEQVVKDIPVGTNNEFPSAFMQNCH
jgi:hypothetical protein